MGKRSPRLQFTEEERVAPELKKAIRKADKKADELEKAEAKIPKKTVKRKERIVDADGKVTTRLYFEEVDKKKPPSKLSHAAATAPINSALATAHREIRQSEEDNVGVESAHKIEEVAEGGVRMVDSAHRSHKLKPYRNAAHAETVADKANLKALNKQAQQNNPQFSSNPYSRWQQKRAIKKEYMAAKAGKNGKNTAKAAQKTAKSAKKAAENTKKSAEFFARHWKSALIAIAILLIVAFLLNVVSSCSVMVQSGASVFGASTYAADDADMLAAEAQYCALEAELQEYLDSYRGFLALRYGNSRGKGYARRCRAQRSWHSCYPCRYHRKTDCHRLCGAQESQEIGKSHSGERRYLFDYGSAGTASISSAHRRVGTQAQNGRAWRVGSRCVHG